MSIILGLNFHHADSAACLVVDGELKYALAEERLGDREKHSSRFPKLAIQRMLKETGVRFKDITHVAIPRNPKSNFWAKARYSLAHPLKSTRAVAEHFRRNKKTSGLLGSFAEIFEEPPESFTFEPVYVEHHLAHIASAYYLSPYDECAGFSYDASGDFCSTMAARCQGTHINITGRVCLPHSLGFFYTALCQYIGFDQFGEEYKVMGLSAYGEPRYADLMQELIQPIPDGWFRLNTRYFGMHSGGESGEMDNNQRLVMGRFYTPALVEKLGPPRRREDPISKKEKDLARSMQDRFEQLALHCFQTLHRRVPSKQLVLAGGCALNGLMNARILRETPFENMYLQAAASDDGTCLGAAYYCWHEVLKQSRRFHMRHAHWGPEYTDSQHRTALEGTRLPIQEFNSNENLFDAVCKLLIEGKIVGWFQGRSEWGPRALGNRSILANPSLPNMKDVLNEKIKRRESFRPFAPSVLKEMAGEYFEQNIESPFMMHVVKLKPEYRVKFPAISHVDGTGRLQTVDTDSNPLYYGLIKTMHAKAGIGMVLNTSFNENEPIVESPEQAVACFLRTGMDALCVGRYLVLKPA